MLMPKKTEDRSGEKDKKNQAAVVNGVYIFFLHQDVDDDDEDIVYVKLQDQWNSPYFFS